MTEQPTTAAGSFDLDKAVADMRKVLPTVVAEIERRARPQDTADVERLSHWLGDLLDEIGAPPRYNARQLAAEYARREQDR